MHMEFRFLLAERHSAHKTLYSISTYNFSINNHFHVQSSHDVNDGIQRKIGPWEINVSGGNVGIQRKSSRDRKKKVNVTNSASL